MVIGIKLDEFGSTDGTTVESAGFPDVNQLCYANLINLG